MMSVAQSSNDGPPVIHPRSHTTTSTKSKPASTTARGSATLVVTCDLACSWSLDGQAQGHLAAGGFGRVKAQPGQHLIAAAASDGTERQDKDVTLETSRQSLVHFELQPLRDLRLAEDRTRRAAAELQAQQEAAHRLQEQRRLENIRLAGERYTQGRALYEQKRYGEALLLFEKSCDGGNAGSCRNLGYMYDEGLGVARDYSRARDLYAKSCDDGDMAGCNNLGVLYDNSRGVVQDYDRAVQLYQKACAGGSMLACKNQGFMYEAGRGVQRNYLRARQLYQQACDGSEMVGCTSLAYLYDESIGVTRDYERARQLYQKACDGNETRACNNLGVLYENGKGVMRDRGRAHQLYQRACDGGNDKGCENLRKLN